MRAWAYLPPGNTSSAVAGNVIDSLLLEFISALSSNRNSIQAHHNLCKAMRLLAPFPKNDWRLFQGNNCSHRLFYRKAAGLQHGNDPRKVGGLRIAGS